MTSRDFCYWLQGFFEITENKDMKPEDLTSVNLTEKQVALIRAHLNLVFKHEIDPSNLDGKTDVEKQEYQEIHDGATSGSFFKEEMSKSPSEVQFNC